MTPVIIFSISSISPDAKARFPHPVIIIALAFSSSCPFFIFGFLLLKIVKISQQFIKPDFRSHLPIRFLFQNSRTRELKRQDCIEFWTLISPASQFAFLFIIFYPARERKDGREIS